MHLNIIQSKSQTKNRITNKNNNKIKNYDKNNRNNNNHHHHNHHSTLKLFRTSLLYQTREFFSNSTLHGVRYIAENGRPFGEKLMWFCFTIAGAIAASIIILRLWDKFQNNPIISGVDTNINQAEWTFPSVVVCPDEAYDEDRMQKLAAIIGKNDDDKIELYQTILKGLIHLTFESFSRTNEIIKNITQYTNLEPFSDIPIRSIAFNIAVFCNQTLEMCIFRDESINCCEYFLPMITDQGFCYGFNTKYFDNEDGQFRNVKLLKIYNTDREWALRFKPLRNARIFVIKPSEYVFKNYVYQKFTWKMDGKSLLVLLDLVYMHTTAETKDLTISQRKCFIENEITFDYFNEPTYSFSNCVMNCRIAKCIKFCDCIPSFYRPIVGVSYCNLEDFECLSKHINNITYIGDCPQPCEFPCTGEYHYVYKLSIAENPQQSESIVNVGFFKWQSKLYRREVLFGFVDLLVAFGGIAGLFLGFSIISAVEIIYYFTLRACCMLVNEQKELIDIEDKKNVRIQKYYNLSLRPQLINDVKNRKNSNYQSKSRAVDDDADNNRVTNNQMKMIPKRFTRSELKLTAARNISKLNYTKQEATIIRNPSNTLNIKIISPIISNNGSNEADQHYNNNQYEYLA